MKYVLHAILHQNKNSILKPGSKFCPTHLLQAIFSHHPLWQTIHNILTNSTHPPLSVLSKDNRKIDLWQAITYGNHKGAILEKDRVMQTLANKVSKGWQSPITIEVLQYIPDLIAAPLGMEKQTTLKSDGTTKEKY